jgi:hypothetical protein
MPKCPICLAAYFWVFGSVGLAFSSGIQWISPVVVVTLVVLVGTSGLGGGTRRFRGPFFAKVMAALAILVGRFGVPNTTLLVAGMVLLIVACLVDLRPLDLGTADCAVTVMSSKDG